jgi:hypothetical protein
MGKGAKNGGQRLHEDECRGGGGAGLQQGERLEASTGQLPGGEEFGGGIGKKNRGEQQETQKTGRDEQEISGEFIRIAKIISGQQSDLTKAKKAKDKNQIVELEKKIAILDKDARKLGSQYTADASEGESLFNEIDLIYKALVKI